MPTAIISATDPFEDTTILKNLLGKVNDNRIAERAPSNSVALVICDALREYVNQPPKLTDRLIWVLDQLENFQFNKYEDIVLSQVYWAPGGTLPKTKSLRHRRVTPELIARASVVVLCGGNTHALLQSFRANNPVLEALKTTVSENRCLLLAWSAGATSAGCSVEHTIDSDSQLTLRLNQQPCLRGLSLFPNYSFAPHRQRPEHEMLVRYLRRRQPLYYGNNSCLVLLPDGAMLVFCQSRDPIYWNSESIGWTRMDDRL